MPTQIFKIERAPEAKPISRKELKAMLNKHRLDSEWIVYEMKHCRRCGTFSPVGEGEQFCVVCGEFIDE